MLKFKDSTIALISDIHLGVHQDNTSWHTVALNFAKWLNTELKQRNILDIVIPGDVFHDRNEISVHTVSVAHKFFEILKDYNILITVGNHDCFYKDRADINSTSILTGWPNITVVDTLQQITQFNKKISFVPWATDINKIEQSDLIFGHFELNSFYHNNYKICTHGVPTTNILDRGNTIITGHFHKTEHRIYENGQILYVGSPYQQTFADVNCTNGCYIFNIETLKIEEFIENNISPKHFKLKLSECTSGSFNLKQLKEIIPNNIISFIVDKQVTPEQANLFASKLKTLKPFFLRTDFNYEQSNTLLDNNIDFTAVDINQAIEEFVNSLDIDLKYDVITYLHDLYKQAI
jgi:DNA repair exonuclease SbcCD nuclease subunit